jgi:hypothetical protein
VQTVNFGYYVNHKFGFPVRSSAIYSLLYSLKRNDSSKEYGLKGKDQQTPEKGTKTIEITFNSQNKIEGFMTTIPENANNP